MTNADETHITLSYWATLVNKNRCCGDVGWPYTHWNECRGDPRPSARAWAEWLVDKHRASRCQIDYADVEEVLHRFQDERDAAARLLVDEVVKQAANWCNDDDGNGYGCDFAAVVDAARPLRAMLGYKDPKWGEK
jgi:hypothetical protein